jgi:hypothetical protein
LIFVTIFGKIKTLKYSFGKVMWDWIAGERTQGGEDGVFCGACADVDHGLLFKTDPVRSHYGSVSLLYR